MQDLTKYTKDLPATLSKLTKYQKIAFERFQAHCHATKAMESLPGAEEYVEKVREQAAKEEIRAWLSEARIGELLGPGERGGDVRKKHLQVVANDSDEHSRYFARQFHEALLSGKLGKEIEKVETQGPVAYRLPITKPAQDKNSGENEWYTPKEYIEAARAVMGDIDLDPASTAIANSVVQAKKFYTAEDNGLEQDWAGRIFMNPPYASELIKPFIEKFCDEVIAGHIGQGIVLINNATETAWFFLLESVCNSLCLPRGRIKFWNPKKESIPLQGQAILYCGENRENFAEKFGGFGQIWCK